MRQLAYIPAIRAFKPYSSHLSSGSSGQPPRRKSLDAPEDNGTFIKPIKQCFVKNPRMMPMTRLMLTLLSGWAGDDRPIETTTGIIGNHMGRCRRQVFRYLQDAVEEGYLFYSRTKDRIGRYTGIRIVLNFAAIRSKPKPKRRRKAAKTLDVTLKAETNRKHRYKHPNPAPDADFMKRLSAICKRNGFEPPPMPA